MVKEPRLALAISLARKWNKQGRSMHAWCNGRSDEGLKPDRLRKLLVIGIAELKKPGEGERLFALARVNNNNANRLYNAARKSEEDNMVNALEGVLSGNYDLTKARNVLEDVKKRRARCPA